MNKLKILNPFHSLRKADDYFERKMYKKGIGYSAIYGLEFGLYFSLLASAIGLTQQILPTISLTTLTGFCYGTARALEEKYKPKV